MYLVFFSFLWWHFLFCYFDETSLRNTKRITDLIILSLSFKKNRKQSKKKCPNSLRIHDICPNTLLIKFKQIFPYKIDSFMWHNYYNNKTYKLFFWQMNIDQRLFRKISSGFWKNKFIILTSFEKRKKEKKINQNLI